MSLTWYFRADRLWYTCLQCGHGRFVKWKVLSLPRPFFTGTDSFSHLDGPGITSGFVNNDFFSFLHCFALNKLILASLWIKFSLLLLVFLRKISTLGVNVRFSPSASSFVSFFEKMETSGFGTLRIEMSSTWSEAPSFLQSATIKKVR